MTGKLIFYANFIFQFPSTRIGVGFDPSGKDQIACVRHHSVNGADAGWVRFVMTEHDLAHFHKREFIYLQSSQRLFNLIESGDQCAEKSAGLERRTDLVECSRVETAHRGRRRLHQFRRNPLGCHAA